MYELIKELLEQSAVYDNASGYFIKTDQEKFAKLIIEECIGVVLKEEEFGRNNNRHDDYCLGLYEAYREIKDHFGIEQ